MSSKSKKKGEKVLLLPGADGWEVWAAGSESNGFVLSQRSGVARVLDVAGIPPGELTMAFPELLPRNSSNQLVEQIV